MTQPTSAVGRILVVDDQPANLRVVGALLTRHGYRGRHRRHRRRRAALQSASAAPDLMLLDMMMPGMDGFALLAEIKQHRELQGMPVVFLTAAQDRDLLLRAFDAGAVDYVTKPFMPEELLARVNAHVALKLTRDRLERVARERQELVNLVAHDLKNPLSSVLFASEMLLQQRVQARAHTALPADDPRQRRRCRQLHPPLSRKRRPSRNPVTAATRIGPACNLCETLQWLLQRYEMQLEARGMRLTHAAAGCARLRRHRGHGAAPGGREPGDQCDQVRRGRWRAGIRRTCRRAGLLATARVRSWRRALRR